MGKGPTTKTTTKETATTKPNVPGYADAQIQNYYQELGGLFDGDPYQYSTPANDLQKQGAEAAANLGGWQQGLDQAASMAGGVNPINVQAPSFTSYTAPQIANTAGPNVSTYNPVANATAGNVSSRNVSAAQIAPLMTAQAAQAEAQGLFDRPIDQYLNPNRRRAEYRLCIRDAT